MRSAVARYVVGRYLVMQRHVVMQRIVTKCDKRCKE